MKKIWVILGILFILVGCGESVPKCEHQNVKTKYSEGDWFSIEKAVVCDDCMQTIETEDLKSVEYVFNKKFINTDGITVTLDKVTVDGMGSIVMEFGVVGTETSGRTFSVEKMYINDVDANAFLYVSDIKNNKKSNETIMIYNGIEANDLFESQNYTIEMEYEISNSKTYKTLKSDTVTFNLNEYTMVNEVKE